MSGGASAENGDGGIVPVGDEIFGGVMFPGFEAGGGGNVVVSGGSSEANGDGLSVATPDGSGCGDMPFGADGSCGDEVGSGGG